MYKRICPILFLFILPVIILAACQPAAPPFECADDGKGISKENLSKIFDPFFTTK